MSNAGFDHHVGRDPVDQLLDPEHVFRELDDRPAHPAEAVYVFGVPAAAKPGLGDEFERLRRADGVSGAAVGTRCGHRAIFEIDADHACFL